MGKKRSRAELNRLNDEKRGVVIPIALSSEDVGKVCVICGGPILPITTPGNVPLKYCSPTCAAKASDAEVRAYKQILVKSKSEHKAFCAYCGNEFMKMHAKHEWCSTDCTHRARNAKTRELRRAEKVVALAEAPIGVCKQCGGYFNRVERSAGGAVGSRQGSGMEFCSDNCATKWRHLHPERTTDEDMLRNIASELAMNEVLKLGNTTQSIADKFGVPFNTVADVALSKDYIEASRHFARLLAANVQRTVMSNLIGLANMHIHKDEKDVGKKLAVKAEVNKFLATRIFDGAPEVTDENRDKPSAITIVYNLTPDAASKSEEFVYLDEDSDNVIEVEPETGDVI